MNALCNTLAEHLNNTCMEQFYKTDINCIVCYDDVNRILKTLSILFVSNLQESNTKNEACINKSQ